MLTDLQIERYSRQIIMPEVGGRGQERLLASTIVMQGSGHLAITAGLYLAAAGVGCLRVEAAVAAAAADLNPDCRLEAVDPADPWGRRAQLAIAAGLEVLATRAAIEACRLARLPLILAYRVAGRATTAVLMRHGADGPCAGYRGL